MSGSVQDANNVLARFDGAKFSWFHVTAVIIAGMGFLCDAYDLFCISLVTKSIGRIYYPDVTYYSPEACQYNGLVVYNSTSFDARNAVCSSKYADTIGSRVSTGEISYSNAIYHVPSAMPHNVDSALKAVALCGTLVGQLLFGYLGDVYGRKPVFGATLVLMGLSSIGSGLSFGSTPTGVLTTLCIFRFILGIGVGGDYPLSATLMSEYSSRSNRGRFIAAVFAMQGTGILLAALVTVGVAACFQGRDADADIMWRVVLMFGLVPTFGTMYWRMKLPETPRFTLHVRGNLTQANQDANGLMKPNGTTELGDASTPPAEVPASPVVAPSKMSWREFLARFGVQLFGCASTWFLLDVAFYSQNLFQPDVFAAAEWIPKAWTMTIVDETFTIAKAQAIIAMCSTVPGYWMTVACIEKLGRFWIQVLGFVMMTLFMVILAADYTNLRDNHVTQFVILYAMCFFFANFGPNATTFVIPAELFPSAFRSTAHGISAACGKAGAIVGAFAFSAVQERYGLGTCLASLAVVNCLGLLCTYFVPETKGKSLEELSQEGSELVTVGKLSAHKLSAAPLAMMNSSPDADPDVESASRSPA